MLVAGAEFRDMLVTAGFDKVTFVLPQGGRATPEPPCSSYWPVAGLLIAPCHNAQTLTLGQEPA